MNTPHLNNFINPGVPKNQYYIPSPIPGFYPHHVHPLSYYHFQPILFQQNIGDYMNQENLKNQQPPSMYKNYVYNNPYTYNFYGNVSNNQFQKINNNNEDFNKKNKNNNIKKNEESFDEDESENYSEEKPIKQKRGRKKEKKKLTESEISLKNTFGKFDHLKPQRDSNLYKNVSGHFSFPLKDLLKFEKIVDEEILKRTSKEILADMKHLNKVPGFSKYTDIGQSPKTDFKSEYEEEIIEDSLNHSSEARMLMIRRTGNIIKLIKENYGLICSTKEVKNLLKTNRGYKKVMNLIIFKNDKIKNLIQDQRNS
jgi:hypothetical protein